VRVSQRKLLIAILLHHPARPNQSIFTECFDCEPLQNLDKSQELHRPLLIVASQKPSMPLRNH
jgi:hypothetical protein